MSKNVVMMTAVQVPGWEHRSKPYRYGIDSFKKWCDKNDCEFFLLDELIVPHEDMKINFQRYYVYELLEQSGIDYNQICITDADCIIHPDCPNFFELTDNKWTVTHCDGDYDWTIRSMENYAHSFDEFEEFDIFKYFNSGFQIINKEHKKYYEELLEFYWDNKDKIIETQKKYGVGTDQPIINHLCQKNKVEMKYLPYQFCMVDLIRKDLLGEDMLFTKIPGIYQFNAIPGNENNTDPTATWMEKAYNYLEI
jgi:hypothetical protein